MNLILGTKLLPKGDMHDLIEREIPGIPSKVFLRAESTDLKVFSQVFDHLEYDLTYPENVRSIVDCGANVGFASVYFRTRFPKAKIVAVEPESENFEMLSKNTSGLSVHCMKRGVAAKSGEILNLIDPGKGSWAFQVGRDVKNGRSIERVETISIPRIQEVLETKFIDILKIDIEGGEKNLFESDYESWLPFVRLLIIEFHERLATNSRSTVLEAISKFSFEKSRVGENVVFRNQKLTN